MRGYPIRTPSDHSSVDSSPRLIAASHVLHRLLVPRHPPCALKNLHTKPRKKMLASTMQISNNKPTTGTTHPPTQRQPRRYRHQPAERRNKQARSLRHPTAHPQPTPTTPARSTPPPQGQEYWTPRRPTQIAIASVPPMSNRRRTHADETANNEPRAHHQK